MKYIVFPIEKLSEVSQEVLERLHLVPRLSEDGDKVIMKLDNYEKLFPSSPSEDEELVYPYPVYDDNTLPGLQDAEEVTVTGAMTRLSGIETYRFQADNDESADGYSDGLILKYKDSTLGWQEYLWDGTKWLNFSEYCEVSYSDIKYNTGTFYTSAGNNAASADLHSTYFVHVGTNDYIYCRTYTSASDPRIVYFDKDYNFISAFTSGKAGLDSRIIKPSDRPEGTKYFSINNNEKYNNLLLRLFSPNAKIDLSEKILDLSERVNEAYKQIGHKEVASWKTNDLSPRASYNVGNREIANEEGIYLVHVHQDTSGKNRVRIVGELQKNNLFKFTDGSYAPTVVITDSDYDATNIDLYADPTHTNLAYAAGNFDATDWWLKNNKAEQPLYNISGAKVYVRKPWESKDLGYDIVIGWRKTIWMLGGEFDQNGNTLFGFFSNPTYYNGFLTKEVSPTGYCLDLPTYYKNALRCIYIKDTGGSTSIGQGSFFDVRRTNRAYPRTGVSQLSTMTQARARNIGDVQSSMPVCEGMGFHKLSHIYSRYIKYLRYDLHQDSLWGPGISSNISPNSTTWDKYSGGSGIKFSMNGGNPAFHTFAAGPNITWSSGSTTTTNWNTWINQEYPKGRTLEAQMALSWAVEKGIEPETKFTWDEEEYVYTNIPHLHTLLEGPDMNARLFKWTDFSGEPYEKGSANKVVVTGQMKLQWPVCDGMVLWGDVFDYGYAGLEVVVDVVTPTSSGTHRYTNPFIAYLCTSQENLIYLNSSYTSGGGFGFEGTYEKIGEGIRNGEGYSKNLFPYSIVPVAKGGGTLYTGSCAYSTNYDNYGDTVFSVAGRKVRAAMRGRGTAAWSYDSARYWHGNDSQSASNRYCAASLQVALA